MCWQRAELDYFMCLSEEALDNNFLLDCYELAGEELGAIIPIM